LNWIFQSAITRNGKRQRHDGWFCAGDRENKAFIGAAGNSTGCHGVAARVLGEELSARIADAAAAQTQQKLCIILRCGNCRIDFGRRSIRQVDCADYGTAINVTAHQIDKGCALTARFSGPYHETHGGFHRRGFACGLRRCRLRCFSRLGQWLDGLQILLVNGQSLLTLTKKQKQNSRRGSDQSQGAVAQSFEPAPQSNVSWQQINFDGHGKKNRPDYI
jgi:hypothetical protein